MSFFAIPFAPLIEQVRPTAQHNPVHAGLLRVWARSISHPSTPARPSLVGWRGPHRLLKLPSAAARRLLAALTGWRSWPFAMLTGVAVLYTTLGLRQFSHHFTGDAATRWTTKAGRARLLAQRLAGGSTSRRAIRLVAYRGIPCRPRIAMCLGCWAGSRCSPPQPSAWTGAGRAPSHGRRFVARYRLPTGKIQTDRGQRRAAASPLPAHRGVIDWFGAAAWRRLCRWQKRPSS